MMKRPVGQSTPNSHLLPQFKALIVADIGIARLGVNLKPPALQDEINRRNFILGLDRIVSDMINSHQELGHGDLPFTQEGMGCFPIIRAGTMPCATHFVSRRLLLV